MLFSYNKIQITNVRDDGKNRFIQQLNDAAIVNVFRDVLCDEAVKHS